MKDNTTDKTGSVARAAVLSEKEAAAYTLLALLSWRAQSAWAVWPGAAWRWRWRR